MPPGALSLLREEWRANGERVVFTNGCFDLLHRGHIHYLAQAANLGDRFIIGLNSDRSVSRLKGPHRPLQDEVSRALILGALGFIDAICIFEEETPARLVSKLLPDMLVKGGDYRIGQIVGADTVMQHGGSVAILPFLPGYSTTRIEQRIKEQG